MTPPRLATAILSRALGHDPSRVAILGDLHEEYVRLGRLRGGVPARLWYWRETLLLSTSRLAYGVARRFSKGHWMNGRSLFGALGQDGLHALRAVVRAPGFSLFSAIVIALGVGASAGVFSVLKPLFIAPLPVHDPDALVWISYQEPTNATSLSGVTSRSGNLRDFRERAGSFDGLTGYNAFSEQGAYTLTGDGEPERLVGFQVAGDFLQVLGVEPIHGRRFTVEEGEEGGPPAVILSHAFWRLRFAADPSIVGGDIILNGSPRTVAGVLPPSFDFSSLFTPGVRVDFLLPYPVSDETDRHGNEVIILGRLRPGVTPQAAQAELDGVLAGLQAEQPDRWGLSAYVEPMQDHISGPFRPALFLLVAAAGTLLLIVCVNLSNLLLSRSPRPAGEMALRKALGASQGRIARQLVFESLGVALVGAVLGTGLAWLAVGAVAGGAGMRVPLLDQVRLDASAVLVGSAVALLTGLLVSLVPALRVAEGREASVLRESSRGASAGRRALRLREGLVVAEVALACVLVAVGGLLARSFREVLEVDLGFQPAEVVAWQLRPSTVFETAAEMSGFFTILTRRVSEIPGVEEVGLIDALPLGRNRNWTLWVPGVHGEEDQGIGYFPHMVDPGYLSTMGIPLVEGRGFSADDREGAPLAVLVNETGAERLAPGESVIGRRLSFGWVGEGEVVGVVRDVRHVSPEAGPGIQIYFSMSQVVNFPTLDIVVRTRLPTRQITDMVASALREVDSQMPVRESWTVQSTVDRAVSARRFTLGILTAYGAAALLLAALGIYGVLAQSVAERTQEIGVRMALGASGADVVRSVLGRTLVLTGTGIVIGSVVSFWTGRLLESLLFGIGARDPITFVGMALVLLLVAVFAGWVPAARAARIRGTRALQAQ